MNKILTKQINNPIIAEEENLLDWNEILKKINIAFGEDIYESWIKNITLKKVQIRFTKHKC